MKLQGRLQRDVNWVKVLRKGERVHSGQARDGPSYGDDTTKGHGEETRVKGFTV